MKRDAYGRPRPLSPTEIVSAADRAEQRTGATEVVPAVSPVPLNRIKDGGAQMRVEMRPETVNDYAADMLSGATFPPVVAFYDGADYWLGDGFHRVEAARKIESETIVADVRQGTARDAVLYGVGANASHGLRRTHADKRRAIERLVPGITIH